MLSAKLGPIGSQRDHSQPAAGATSHSPQPATKPTQQSLAIQVAVLTEKLMQAEDTINDLRRREEAAKKASQVLVNELKVGQSDNLIRGLREDIIMLKKTREMDNTILKTQCNEILQAVQNSVKKRDNLMASRQASVSKEKYRDERSPIYGEISSFPKLADLEDEPDHLPFKASAKKGSYRAISTDFAEDDQSSLVEDLRAKIHSLQRTLRAKDSKINELSALLAGGEITPRGAESIVIPTSRTTVYLKCVTILGTKPSGHYQIEGPQKSTPLAIAAMQEDKAAQFPSARGSMIVVDSLEGQVEPAFVQTWPGLTCDTQSNQTQALPTRQTAYKEASPRLPIQASLISSSHYNLLRVDEQGQERETHTPQDGVVRRDLRHMFEEYPSPHRDQALLPQKVRSTKGGLFSGCTTPVQGKQTVEPAGFLRTASRGSLLNGDGGFKLVVGRFQSVGEGWMDEGRPLPMFDSIQTQMGRTGAKSSRTNLEIAGNNAEILETKAEDQLCDDSLLEREGSKAEPTGCGNTSSKIDATKHKNSVVPPLNLRPADANFEVHLPTPKESIQHQSDCKLVPLQSKTSSHGEDSEILKEFTDPDALVSVLAHEIHEQTHTSENQGTNTSHGRVAYSRKHSHNNIEAKENTPPPGFKNSQHSKSASDRKSPFLNAEPLTPGAFLDKQTPRDSGEQGDDEVQAELEHKPAGLHQRGLSNTFGGHQLQTLLHNPVFRTEGALTNNSSELNLERQFEADIEYSRRVPQLQSRELGLNTLRDDETNHSGSAQHNMAAGFRRLHPEYGSFGHPHTNQEDLETKTALQNPLMTLNQPKIAESIPGELLYQRNLLKSTLLNEGETEEDVFQMSNKPKAWQVFREGSSTQEGINHPTRLTPMPVGPQLQEQRYPDRTRGQDPCEVKHHQTQSQPRPDSHLFNLTKSQFPQTLTPFINFDDNDFCDNYEARNLLPQLHGRGVSPLSKIRGNSIGNKSNNHAQQELVHTGSGTSDLMQLSSNPDHQMFGAAQKLLLPKLPVKQSHISNNSAITYDMKDQPQIIPQSYRSGYSANLPLPKGPYIDASGVRTQRAEANRVLFEEPWIVGQPEASLPKTNYADLWQGIKRRRSISGQSNKSAVMNATGRGQHMAHHHQNHSTVTQDGEQHEQIQDKTVHRKTKSVIGTQDNSSSKHRENCANRLKMPPESDFHFPMAHHRDVTDLVSSQLATKRTHSIGQQSDVRDHVPNPLDRWVQIDDDRSAVGGAHSTTTSQKRHLHLKTGYCGMVKHIAIDLVEDSMSSTDRERVHKHDLFDSKSPMSAQDIKQEPVKKPQDKLPPKNNSNSRNQSRNKGNPPNQPASTESVHDKRRSSSSLTRNQITTKSPSMSSKKNRMKVGIAEKARQIIGKSSFEDKSHTEVSVSVANSALTAPYPSQTKQQLFSHMQKVRAITEPNENSYNSLWSKPANQRDKSQMGSYTPLRAMESPKGGLVKMDDTSNYPSGPKQAVGRTNTPLRPRFENPGSNRQMSPLLSGLGKYTTEPSRQHRQMMIDDAMGNQIDQMKALAQQSVRMINNTIQNSGAKAVTPNLKSLGPSLTAYQTGHQSHRHLADETQLLGSPQSFLAAGAPRELKKPQKNTEQLFRGKENHWEVNQVDIKTSGIAEKSRLTHQHIQENPLSNAKDREFLFNTNCTPSAAKSIRGSVDMVTELLVDRVQEMEKRLASHRDKSSTKKTRPSHVGSTNSLLANSRTNL